MAPQRLVPLPVAALVAFGWASAPGASAQTHSEPVALHRPIDAQVTGLQLTTDGRHVVFVAEHSRLPLRHVLAVAPVEQGVASGGGLRVLTPAFTTGLRAPRFEITGDGRRVVYLADQDGTGVDELYSVPLERTDGEARPVRLNMPLPPGRRVLGFFLSPDGRHVAFSSNVEVSSVLDVYGVAADGRAAPVKLNPKYVQGGDLRGMGIAPRADGALVLYSADQETDGVNELFAVPIDGSAPAIKLSDAAAPQVGSFRATPDGTRVVYHAQVKQGSTTELYVAPTTGGVAPKKLNHDLTRGTVAGFEISPSGDRVAYQVSTYPTFQLWSRPIAAQRAAKPLSRLVGSIGAFEFTATGERVVWEQQGPYGPSYFVRELLSVPAHLDHTSATRLDAVTQIGEFSLIFELSPDGGAMAYRSVGGWSQPPVTGFLRVVRTDGTDFPTLIAPIETTSSDVVFDPSGERLYFSSALETPNRDLYVISTDGSAGPARLTTVAQPMGTAGAPAISSDGRTVVFRAQMRAPNHELFGVRVEVDVRDPQPGTRVRSASRLRRR